MLEKGAEVMQRVSFNEIGLRYTLSPYAEPVATVSPGETILLETEDACSGQIGTPGDARDPGRVPFSNPVVGPICVRGAEPGMALSVSIKEIRPSTGRGVTYLSRNYLVGAAMRRFIDMSLEEETKICEIKSGSVHFGALTLPYRPMVGTIGVAPHPEKEAMSSQLGLGRHGGNIDLPEVHPGSTILLPIFHRGALLYVGDVHAVQGDGEICGTGIEMPAEVEITTNLVQESLVWPRIETDSEVLCVATAGGANTLADAIKTAFLELILWMERSYGLQRLEGLLLCSQVGKVRIGNLWSAAAKIEKKVLAQIAAGHK
jgi:acetamidase/formamidase